MNDSPPRSLVDSFAESWSVYLRNPPQVWSYLFRLCFAAIGALLSGRLMTQLALASIDFFLRLKARDPWPSRSFERYLGLTNAQLGVGAMEGFANLFNYMLWILIGLVIVIVGVPSGLAIAAVQGGLGGPSISSLFVALLVPLVLGGIPFCYAVAVLHLQAGIVVKLGTANLRDRQEEVAATLRRHVLPFALYMGAATLASYAGLFLCCVGILVTLPYAVVAGYVGVINLFGIALADVERFLEAPSQPTA